MLPNNITKEHILTAIEEIDENGVVKGRESRKYHLVFNGKHYPPKYVVSLANMSANGKMFPPDEFGGGKETNDYLRKLGFEITPNHDCEVDDA